jgi:hypothetical protein
MTQAKRCDGWCGVVVRGNDSADSQGLPCHCLSKQVGSARRGARVVSGHGGVLRL